MNIESLKLMVEQVNEYELITEQQNQNRAKQYKIRCPYVVCNVINENRRRYIPEIVEPSINEVIETKIKQNKLIGELNHPGYHVPNYERACHKIDEIVRDGDSWIGTSTVLNGVNIPLGDLVAGLLESGIKIGLSSRGVGKSATDGIVQKYKYITQDIVSDPSAPGAWVDGIMESKSYMVDGYGNIVEMAYDRMENSLSTLPRDSTDRQMAVAMALQKFINSIK